VIVATSRLVLSALINAGSWMNWWYHFSVNPSQGNDTISLSLNEKMIKITIGAYRNTTRNQNTTQRVRRPPVEIAGFIPPPSAR
jgi:hypothetical protein